MMAAPVVPSIQTLFEPTNGTWQCVVEYPNTSQAAIIDPVLNFNAATNKLGTKSADEILALVKEKEYNVTYLLETHVHAGHLTAANYLEGQLEESSGQRPKTCIGKRIKDAQARFSGRFGIPAVELEAAFDHLCDDGEKFLSDICSVRSSISPGTRPIILAI
jgi:glyoxylase-like metal-dependent hydrolase (beta-lactamase superfamily II)